jgi:hypothetical protein
MPFGLKNASATFQWLTRSAPRPRAARGAEFPGRPRRVASSDLSPTESCGPPGPQEPLSPGGASFCGTPHQATCALLQHDSARCVRALPHAARVLSRRALRTIASGILLPR